MSAVVTAVLIACLLAFALVGYLLYAFRRGEAELRAESEAHWQAIASAILEQNPDADVSWCFRRNRPPFRSPSAPPSAMERSP